MGRVAAAGRKRHSTGVDVHVPQETVDQARRSLMVARLEREIHYALYPDPPYDRVQSGDRERLANVLRRGYFVKKVQGDR